MVGLNSCHGRFDCAVSAFIKTLPLNTSTTKGIMMMMMEAMVAVQALSGHLWYTSALVHLSYFFYGKQISTSYLT